MSEIKNPAVTSDQSLPLLKVKDLHVYYGAIHAVKGISLEVYENEIVTLIGANGAGKSTLLRSIIGLVKVKSGNVEYNGDTLTGLNSQQIVSKGLTLVPEGRRVFPNLTVLENLRIGAYMRKDEEGIAADIKRIYEIFPRLEERKNQFGGLLSGGEQQMLAIARGLMARPKMLMLDEPSLGLAPIIVNQIMDTLRSISESGTTILLVEQNAKKALELCDRAYVMNVGHIVMEGTGKELLADENLMQAYLG